MTKIAHASCAICPHMHICRLLEYPADYRYAFCAYVPVQRKLNQPTEGRHQPPAFIPDTYGTYSGYLKTFIQEHQQ